jgi:hypothetical protein
VETVEAANEVVSAISPSRQSASLTERVETLTLEVHKAVINARTS